MTAAKLLNHIYVLLAVHHPGDMRLIREMLVFVPSEIQNVVRFHLLRANRLAQAELILDTQQADVLLLDHALPDGSGVDTVRHLAKKYPHLPILSLVAAGSEDLGVEMIRSGAQDCLVKGRFNRDVLHQAIHYGIERKRMTDMLQRLNNELELRVLERTQELADVNQALQDDQVMLRFHHQRIKSLADLSQKLAEITPEYPGILDLVTRWTAEQMDGVCAVSLITEDVEWVSRAVQPSAGSSKNPADEAHLIPGFEEHYSAALPLQAHGEILGEIKVSRSALSGPFPEDDIQFLVGIADRIAQSLQNARLFAQITNSRKSLSVLSSRLVEVQEKERREIARELHDEIGQELTGLKLMLKGFSSSNIQRQRADFLEAEQLVNSLLGKVRELSLNLRPAMLDDLGLLPALLWLVDRYSAQTSIEILFRHSGIEHMRFSPGVETGAFRIIQEAMTNIARHAGVNRAEVAVRVEDSLLRILVEDNGKGFDPEIVRLTGTSSGLTGMQERAISLGGSCTIYSTPGKGTRLLAALPIVEEKDYR
jgi:signal transduction histidine kinase